MSCPTGVNDMELRHVTILKKRINTTKPVTYIFLYKQLNNVSIWYTATNYPCPIKYFRFWSFGFIGYMNNYVSFDFFFFMKSIGKLFYHEINR